MSASGEVRRPPLGETAGRWHPLTRSAASTPSGAAAAFRCRGLKPRSWLGARDERCKVRHHAAHHRAYVFSPDHSSSGWLISPTPKF